MGKTRPTIRTLSSGERVTHYPPSEGFPDGRMVLIQEGSAVADELDARREQHEDSLRDLKTIGQSKVTVKKEAEAAYPAVPPEKRFI